MMKYVSKKQGSISGKEKMLLIMMTVGLSALLILRDIMGIGISKFLYLGFIVAFMAIAQYKTLVYMICFVFPLLCGLPGTYIMPCALVLMIIKKGKIGAHFLAAAFVIALAELMASFWYSGFSFANYIQYVSFALMMFAFIYEITDVDYMLCVKIFFYGVCLLCAVIMLNALSKAPSNWLTLFAKGQFRIGQTHMTEIEGMALSLNANSLAYYSITGIACGVLLVEKGSKKERVPCILLTLLVGAAGFLTISRSWLLVAAICLVLYIASKLGSIKRIIQMMVVMAIAVVAATAFFNENPDLLAGFVTRMKDDDVQGGNGRVEVALMYLERMAKDPRLLLLGTGVLEYRTLLGMTGSIHNGTVQVLVCYGFLGASVFLFGLIAPLFKLMRTRVGLTWWLPLISVALFVQTIQFINPYFIMLPYGIGVVAVKAGVKRYENIFDNCGHRGR